MSYQMIHLEIAYRLLEQYKWINCPGDFLLGAIAPDAVHFMDEYHVSFKEKSHLWNCGPKWGITTQSHKWKENVLEFWNRHREESNKDFLAGYCVHILTDWLNDLRIWTPFREANMKENRVEEIYHIYGREAYGSDQWLYRNSSHTEEIMQLLAKGRAYSVEGCIEAELIEKQKQNILNHQYAGTDVFDIDSYKYCTREKILAFLEEGTELLGKLPDL